MCDNINISINGAVLNRNFSVLQLMEEEADSISELQKQIENQLEDGRRKSRTKCKHPSIAIRK